MASQPDSRRPSAAGSAGDFAFTHPNPFSTGSEEPPRTACSLAASVTSKRSVASTTSATLTAMESEVYGILKMYVDNKLKKKRGGREKRLVEVGKKVEVLEDEVSSGSKKLGIGVESVLTDRLVVGSSRIASHTLDYSSVFENYTACHPGTRRPLSSQPSLSTSRPGPRSIKVATIPRLPLSTLSTRSPVWLLGTHTEIPPRQPLLLSHAKSPPSGPSRSVPSLIVLENYPNPVIRTNRRRARIPVNRAFHLASPPMIYSSTLG